MVTLTMLVSIITLIVCWPYAAFAGTITGAFYRQTIQYVNSDNKTANDLRLKLSQEQTLMPGVTAAKITTRATPPQSSAGVPIDGGTVEFAQNTFGTVTPNSKVDIDLGPKDPKLKAPKILRVSEWTEDGEHVLSGDTTIIGKPMRIKPDPLGDPGTVEFFSDDNLQIMYSNIQVYINNNLANFNIDNFLTPTGSLVTGIPISTPIDTNESCTSSLIILNPNPNHSCILSIGITDPLKYILAIADVAPTSDPSNTYIVAAAATEAVPEQALYCCLALASLASSAMAGDRGGGVHKADMSSTTVSDRDHPRQPSAEGTT